LYKKEGQEQLGKEPDTPPEADPGFFYGGGGLKIVFFGTWDIIYNIAVSD
jgi:hypothetical protein